MAVPGDVFQAQADPYHRWIVITTPDEDGDVVIVNLTTLRRAEQNEGLILQRQDYPEYIDRPTAVRFSGAQQGAARNLEEHPEAFSRVEQISGPTLRKIQEAAAVSKHMRKVYREVVAREIATPGS